MSLEYEYGDHAADHVRGMLNADYARMVMRILRRRKGFTCLLDLPFSARWSVVLVWRSAASANSGFTATDGRGMPLTENSLDTSGFSMPILRRPIDTQPAIDSHVAVIA